MAGLIAFPSPQNPVVIAKHGVSKKAGKTDTEKQTDLGSTDKASGSDNHPSSICTYCAIGAWMNF